MRDWRRRKREDFQAQMAELARLRAEQIARRKRGRPLAIGDLADKYADR